MVNGEMKHHLFFQNPLFILRPLEKKDIKLLRNFRNRPENRKWFFYDKEIDANSQEKWYETYLKTENDYMFAVCLKTDPDMFVGSIAIYDFDKKENSFQIGRLLLDSKKMPRSHMSIEIIAAVCGIVKENFGEEVSLNAEIFANNTRSIHAFISNGFVIAGNKYINGKLVCLLTKDMRLL